MNTSIDTTRVQDVMVKTVVTVHEADKMQDVARVFDQNDINAAPVVNAAGNCIGIITSHDMVEYESQRIEISNEISHGSIFNTARYGDGPPQFPLLRFEEAGYHLTGAVETAKPGDTLSSAARTMCRNHIHHVIILDLEDKPIGILSSLDILGHILDEPVCRTVP